MTTYINILIIAMLILILILYKRSERIENDSNMDELIDVSQNVKQTCRKNSMNNPYGNYLLFSDPSEQSCGNDNEADTYNSFNLYENGFTKHITSFNKAYRNFYTTPYSSMTNDTIAFANFLKQPILTCKTDGYCLQYNDVRYHAR